MEQQINELLGLINWGYLATFVLLSWIIMKYIYKPKFKPVFLVLIVATVIGVVFSFLGEELKGLILSYSVGVALYDVAIKHLLKLIK